MKPGQPVYLQCRCGHAIADVGGVGDRYPSPAQAEFGVLACGKCGQIAGHGAAGDELGRAHDAGDQGPGQPRGRAVKATLPDRVNNGSRPKRRPDALPVKCRR